MSTYVLYAADVAAIALLVFGLFLPRHRRPELVVAYLTVNVGVLAVSAALASSTVAAGLGLGLFGILSIIRLRSEELAQHEIAYYFAALALGLLGGLGTSAGWIGLALMAAVLLAIAIGDHPSLARRPSSQELMLDHAITDHEALSDYLATLLHADIVSVKAIRTDLVNDTTLVAVRYHPRPSSPAVAAAADRLEAVR